MRGQGEGRSASGALALALSILAGCQSYEPRPLDALAHREAWFARSLERESMLELLRDVEDRAELGLVPPQSLDPGDGLSLREGQLVALIQNPRLRLARARLGPVEAGARHAGLWNDPRFDLSLLRNVDGVPDPWVIAPGLVLSLPLSGRLDTERGLAEARRDARRAALLEEEWAVWRDVRIAWVEWSAARLRAEESERLGADLEELARIAEELADRGEFSRAQASLVRVEQSRGRAEHLRLVGEARVLEQRLRALLGLAPTVSVECVPALVPAARADGEAVPGDDARTAALAIEHRHPRLAQRRREYEVAEASLRHAIREQYPDLDLGPLFESDEGDSRLGIGLSIPIPILNGNRRAIEEARAGREAARVAVEVAREELLLQWAETRARVRALESRRRELAGGLLPWVERLVEETAAQRRLGEGADPWILLESLRLSHGARLELVDTRAAESVARTELAYLMGPVPSARSSAVEDSER